MIDLNRRSLLTASAAAGTAATLYAAMPAVARAATEKVPLDPMTLVDPELRPFLEKALAPGGPPPPPRPERYRLPLPAQEPAPCPPTRMQMIPGIPGQPPVRVFVIGEARPGESRPAILHIHGGGYVGFSAEPMVPILQPLAQRLGCVIVTVDYRLAPETRLSGSLDDNYAALQWLHGSAEELGIDPQRIVVAGESAGGGHAAMLAIAARDRGGPPIKAQVLTYPMLDDRTGSTHPVPSFIGTYVWQPEDNRYGWSSLLGIPAGDRRAPKHLVPGRVEDLSGLPPAFIGVGSLDLFVDEDIEYARRLVAAGVPAELHVYPGAFHGFEIFVPEARISRAFVEAREKAFTKALG